MSIWTRRRKSRKRLRALEDEEAAAARQFGLDPEEVRGPIPFIPRYFPGTVPPSPPPYEPSASDDGHARSTTAETSSVSNNNSTTHIIAPIPRRIAPPETSQLESTPPVSIAAASIMNRSLTSSGRRTSILSYGDVAIPYKEAEESPVVSHSQPPPGLIPPPEEETPIMRSRPSSRHSRRSFTQPRAAARREDDMSDTENGVLLPPAATTAPVVIADKVSYRDESPDRL
jgi:hypothetical protein